MKKTVIALCLLLFIAPAKSDAMSVQVFRPFCERSLLHALNVSRLRTLGEGESAPIIGLLVQAKNGRKFLGLAPYLGVGHGNILKVLEEMYPHLIDESNPMSFQSLWSGEIKLIGSTFQAETAEANELSGFGEFMKKVDDRNVNSVANLKAALEQGLPDFVDKNTRYTPYTESSRHFVVEMGQFNGGLRHGLGNLANRVSKALVEGQTPMNPVEIRAHTDKFLLAIRLHRQFNWLTSGERRRLSTIERLLKPIKLSSSWNSVEDRPAFIEHLYWLAKLATQSEKTIVEIYEL